MGIFLKFSLVVGMGIPVIVPLHWFMAILLLFSKSSLQLNSGKTQVHDRPSISMLQTSSYSISKSLSTIFRNCLKTGFTLTYKRIILSPSKRKEKSSFKQFLVCFPIIYLFVKNFLIKSYSIQFSST